MKPRGFTLVELLIATALGTLLVAGALGAYARGRALYERSERLARLHELASYALSVLEPDVQMAGYYGFHAAGAGMRLPAAVPRELQRCSPDFVTAVQRPIEGTDQHYALGCAASGGGAQPLADTLTLRRAQVEAVAPIPGRLQVLSDRRTPAGQALLLDTRVPVALQPGQVELRDLAVHSYYVARRSDGQSDADLRSGSAVPALRVKTLGAIAGRPAIIDTEVLSGIEDLQVEFGCVTGDSVAAAPVFVAASAVPATARVVAVRLWVRLRAEQPDAGYADRTHYRYANQHFIAADHFQRLLVSRTIQLRNALP